MTRFKHSRCFEMNFYEDCTSNLKTPLAFSQIDQKVINDTYFLQGRTFRPSLLQFFLSDWYGIRTHKHLVRKRTLNHLASLASDIAPASSQEFLDFQATIECRFTLKRVQFSFSWCANLISMEYVEKKILSKYVKVNCWLDIALFWNQAS